MRVPLSTALAVVLIISFTLCLPRLRKHFPESFCRMRPRVRYGSARFGSDILRLLFSCGITDESSAVSTSRSCASTRTISKRRVPSWQRSAWGMRLTHRLFQEETGITFPLLIDEQRRAYKAVGLKSANILHLLRSDNSKARARARSAGHQQHRLGRNPFQLGGSFVFAPANRDIYAHLSKTFGDNASAEALLRAVRTAGSANAR